MRDLVCIIVMQLLVSEPRTWQSLALCCGCMELYCEHMRNLMCIIVMQLLVSEPPMWLTLALLWLWLHGVIA